MRILGSRAFLLSLAVLLSASARSPGAVEYSILNLGQWVYPKALNDHGQVVGSGRLVPYSATVYPFRTAPNSPVNPATDVLGFGEQSEWQACDINNSGVVVGYGSSTRAFRVGPGEQIGDPGTMLDSLLGHTISMAYGINDSGQIAGVVATGWLRAFRTAPGSPIDPATDLVVTDVHSGAYAINNSGQVTGYYQAVPNVNHAFRTAANQAMNPATDDLGTLGGISAAGHGINTAGQVAGFSSFSNGLARAFRTTATGVVDAESDLGVLRRGLSSRAYGINDAGDCVGYAGVVGTIDHAFLARANSPMIDLNTLIDPLAGWELRQAYDINGRGQIVGWGRRSGYTEDWGFLLTPVPEPTSLILLAAGGLLLATRSLRMLGGQ